MPLVHRSGSPGGHAASLARAARLRALGFSLLCAGSLLLAALLLEHVGATRALAVMPALVALFAAAGAQHFTISANKAAAGARSERRVAKVLDRLPVRAVLHSQLLGAGGDVDHLVAGPLLVAIETKTGSGPLRHDRRGLTVNNRTLPTDPVAQVRRQTRALSRLAGVPASGVVCVLDATSSPLTVDGVTICSLRDLPSVLAAQPHRLDDRAVETLLAALTHPARRKGPARTDSRPQGPSTPPVTPGASGAKLKPLRRR